MDAMENLQQQSECNCISEITAPTHEVVLAGVQHYACEMHKFTNQASNDSHIRKAKRDRTVPILDSVIHVPGYPEKLAIFKMQASRFWQVRCWNNGKTYRRSTRSQSKRSALIYARIFYEQLMAELQTASGRISNSKLMSYLYQQSETIVMDIVRREVRSMYHTVLANVHDAIYIRQRLLKTDKQLIEMKMRSGTGLQFWFLDEEKITGYTGISDEVRQDELAHKALIKQQEQLAQGYKLNL